MSACSTSAAQQDAAFRDTPSSPANTTTTPHGAALAEPPAPQLEESTAIWLRRTLHDPLELVQWNDSFEDIFGSQQLHQGCHLHQLFGSDIADIELPIASESPQPALPRGHGATTPSLQRVTLGHALSRWGPARVGFILDLHLVSYRSSPKASGESTHHPTFYKSRMLIVPGLMSQQDNTAGLGSDPGAQDTGR